MTVRLAMLDILGGAVLLGILAVPGYFVVMGIYSIIEDRIAEHRNSQGRS